MNQWDFELGDKVKLTMSDEKGFVSGRAEHLDMPHQYCVEYVAADGRRVSDWLYARQLDVDQ